MADPVSSICHGRNFMPLRIIQDKLQPFLTQTFDLIPVDLCDGSAYRTQQQLCHARAAFRLLKIRFFPEGAFDHLLIKIKSVIR